jgi:hypothetical protein
MSKNDKEVQAELLDAISVAIDSLSGMNPNGRVRALARPR